MGFYIRGAPPPRPHTGQLLIHERMPPTRSGQGAGSGSGRERTAHRFGVARYGTIFGLLHGIGWIGTAAGVVGAGLSFDRFHGYWAAQLAAIGLLAH